MISMSLFLCISTRQSLSQFHFLIQDHSRIISSFTVAVAIIISYSFLHNVSVCSHAYFLAHHVSINSIFLVFMSSPIYYSLVVPSLHAPITSLSFHLQCSTLSSSPACSSIYRVFVGGCAPCIDCW